MTKSCGYFHVTSYGRTSTYWLSSALNSHPDILCGHGGYLPPHLEYYEQPDETQTMKTQNARDSFISLTLDEVLAGLQEAGTAKCYGMVHAYVAHHLVQWPQLQNPVHTPRIVNLVRHPILRAQSLARRLIHETSFSDTVKNNLDVHFGAYVPMELRKAVCERSDVDYGSIDARGFIYALGSMAMFDKMDFETPIRHVPMERLISDREHFIWLVNYLTDGSVDIESAYIDLVFSKGRKNYLNDDVSSIARWEMWEPWRQAVFNEFSAFYDFHSMYEHFGYDLGIANRILRK